MALMIFKETSVRIPVTRLRKLYEMVSSTERSRLRTGTVNLVFTTDGRMKSLNSQYRHKDRSTDVLSFSIDEGLDGESYLGEIYISIRTAKSQAGAYGGTLSEELLRLTCHGLLHLAGYDHENSRDERKMKKREARYLRHLIQKPQL